MRHTIKNFRKIKNREQGALRQKTKVGFDLHCFTLDKHIWNVCENITGVAIPLLLNVFKASSLEL